MSTKTIAIADGFLKPSEFDRLLDDDAIRSWPWESEPFRLWSLEDVFRFEQLPIIVQAIEQIKQALHGLVLAETSSSISDRQMREHLKQWVVGLKDSCSTVPLGRQLTVKLERLIRRIEDEANWNSVAIVTLCNEAISDLVVELSSHYFLFIPNENRSFYEQRNALFGDDVENSFPSTAKDIAAAGRCFALYEHTACVFHLMRVVEIGLHCFASHLGLNSQKLALENWKNVIDQIEKEIRKLEQLPKTTAKSEKIQIYSAIAIEFRWFKDAWRNHVAHARSHYDLRESAKVLGAVGSFMKQLAANKIGEPSP